MERYSRNIVIEEIGLQGQEKLLSASVLICGAGGLASTVIANLASMGIGNIGIVDNDNLEISNFNRQYIHKLEKLGKNKADSAKDWVMTYNPDIKAEAYTIRMNESNYNNIVKKYDILVDCFDSYQSKFLLNEIAVKTNKPLIHGGVTEFNGQVMTIIPNKSACLRCIFPDKTTEENSLKGIISSTVSTVGSIQSMEVLKLLLNIGTPLTDQILNFDGLSMRFKKINLSKKLDCILCNID